MKTIGKAVLNSYNVDVQTNSTLTDEYSGSDVAIPQSKRRGRPPKEKRPYKVVLTSSQTAYDNDSLRKALLESVCLAIKEIYSKRMATNEK